MASLRLRWSEQEARKPYARPFMAMFLDDDDHLLGSVAVNGADLLYQRQFVVAVASLGGEVFRLGEVESAPDPQRAWLDRLGELLPACAIDRLTSRSTFDHERGRVFGFTAHAGATQVAEVDAHTLLDYQQFQAALAHRSGSLVRVPAVEQIDDPLGQRRAWDAWVRERLERPPAGDAMSESWPWQ